MTLSGVEKLNTNIPKIRLPLEPVHLYSIYKVLDLSSIQNTVFWALLLIGFYGMLRKSQFANNSRNTFNPKEQLTRVDFQFTLEGLIVNIQWSKTRQRHNKILQIPLKRIEDCVLCSVLAYSRMVKFIPALPQEPAFCLPSTKKNICAFSKSDIDKILKDVLAQCHLDTDQYYVQCLRRVTQRWCYLCFSSWMLWQWILYIMLLGLFLLQRLYPTSHPQTLLHFRKSWPILSTIHLTTVCLLSIDVLHLISVLGIALP